MENFQNGSSIRRVEIGELERLRFFRATFAQDALGLKISLIPTGLAAAV